MAALVLRVLRAHPWRFVPAVPLVVLALLCSPAGEIRPRANRALVRLALRGMSRPVYDRLARSVGADLAAARHSHAEPVWQRLAHERSRGRVVVVTASEHALARAYLDGIGLQGIELIASHLGELPGGLGLVHHNVGAQKVRGLRDRGVGVDEAVLYTDSASDLPLARATSETVLIGGGVRDRRLLRRDSGVRLSFWSAAAEVSR